VVAINFLAHSDYSTAGSSLQNLVGLREPAEVQVAAVRSLGQLSAPEVGPLFVSRERWRAYSPAVREAVVSTLLAQVRLVPALLGAIEKGDVPAWAVDPARRTQLLKHRDETIRKRAETAFANMQSGDRMKVYEDYKSVLTSKADTKSGHAVFARLCTSCHVYNGEGSRVGPELTGIRNQPAEALLLHIIVPDYEIVAGFISYEIETKDGRSLTGLLASETATSVTLRRALGEEENILRSNITTISSTSLSLMPQELEKIMTRQEMADLIAFLKGQ
jgi:putative heme-binding domain-containing protein